MIVPFDREAIGGDSADARLALFAAAREAGVIELEDVAVGEVVMLVLEPFWPDPAPPAGQPYTLHVYRQRGAVAFEQAVQMHLRLGGRVAELDAIREAFDVSLREVVFVALYGGVSVQRFARDA